MDFHGDAFADLVFVDALSERRDGAHVFVAGGKILVVGQPALDHRRRTVMNDLQISCADRDRIDADKDFGALRHRDRLGRQRELIRIAEHPCPHGVRNRKVRRRFHVIMLVHWSLSLM